MIDIKIDSRDIQKIMRNVKRWQSKKRKEVVKELAYTAQEIRTDAIREAPKDTGTLANSINTRRRKNGFNWWIGTNLKYAPFVEFGKPVGTGPNGGPKPFLFPAYQKNVRPLKRNLQKIIERK